MSAVILRICVAAIASAVLFGCAPAGVDEAGRKQEEAKPDAVPEQAAASPPAPASPVSGLGAAGLLGPAPGREIPAPDAAAIEGRVFNGAYAVELGASDQRRAREAIHTALEWLPVGRMKIWRNPDNGHWGTVMATRTYQDAKGLWCREYRQTVTLGGLENQDTGAACRGADGVWRPTG